MAAIAAGVEMELFKVPDVSFTAPLDTFAMRLKPVPSPLREKGKLSEAAQRGKMLFNGDRTKCFACHSGPLFTDCKTHDFAVSDPFDPTKAIFTPSLVEAWRTGPYGHLGSLWYVQEMVELPGHNDARANLNLSEMDDLIAYVMSL
jgi:hypothetical protein